VTIPGSASGHALVARLILAGVFLYAGWDKLHHPFDFASQVAGYRLLPSELIALAAVSLPCIELLAGGSLLLGFLAESSAAVLGALSLGFAGAVSSALLRGLSIECGCFSSSPSLVSWGHVAGDVCLAALAVVILLRGPGPWALDARLQGASPERVG